MDYIQRDLESIIRKASEEYPILLLTGPRQAGKTTMLQKLMEGTGRKYVSLDNLADRNLASMDPALFLQVYKPPVLIDEVLYAPELFSYIRKCSDADHRPGDFWLTGSQVFRQVRGIQTTLAGRVAILSLPYLSQAELCGDHAEPFVVDMQALSARGRNRMPVSSREIFERIVNGDMPAVQETDPVQHEAFYSEFVRTCIERDVKAMAESVDSLKFLRFLTAAARMCSRILNITELIREAGINQKQARDYLAILETLGMIFYLQPYSDERLKRLVKTPRVYFTDTGLVCYLTGQTNPGVLEGSAFGDQVLENYVAAQIRRTYLNNGQDPCLFYYRNKDARQIDLIIEHDGVLDPVQIRKTMKPDESLVRSFDMISRASVARGKGAIICLKPEFSMIDASSFVVPVWAV